MSGSGTGSESEVEEIGIGNNNEDFIDHVDEDSTASESGSDIERSHQPPTASGSNGKAKASRNRNGQQHGQRRNPGLQHTILSDDEVDPDHKVKYCLDEQTFVAAKSSRNVRTKLYAELLQDAQDFEDKDGVNGFDLKDVLTENVVKGHQLAAMTIGTSSTGDMYNAILHATMCSKMIRYQSEKIGDTKVFRADSYIQSIKRQYGDSTRRRLAKLFKISGASSTVCCLIGSFERGKLILPAKKDKKPLVQRRKRVFDESLAHATQHEEIGGATPIAGSSRRRGAGVGDGENNKPSNHAEQVSTNLLKVLKAKSKDRAEPFNYFEFALDKESINHTVQNMFYMGFLFRDGFAKLTAKNSDKECDLVVQPDKPPAKTQNTQSIPRNQRIVSFNPRIYRAMLKAAQGTTEVPQMEQQQQTTTTMD